MEEELNLIDFLRLVRKRIVSIASVVVIVTIGAAGYSLTLPKVYRSESTLMPIGGQKLGGIAGAVQQIGLGGLLGGMGGATSGIQILAMLKSRTLAERVIERLNLMKVFYKDASDFPPLEKAVKQLNSIVTFKNDEKTQLIIVRGDFTDPALAAEIVNVYIDELTRFIQENTFTTAKRNRVFIEAQLERNKAELLQSGKELASFYSNNDVSNVVPNIDVGVVPPSAADLRSLQQKADEAKTAVEKMKVIKDVPQEAYLQYMVLRRQLLGQVNALLTQQYEMAKIDEAKEDLNFQVIDVARVPVQRFKPQRTLIVLTSFVLSCFLGLFLAFFLEYLGKIKNKI